MIANARAHAARAFYRVSCRRRALVVAVTLYSAHSRNCGDTTPNAPHFFPRYASDCALSAHKSAVPATTLLASITAATSRSNSICL